MSKKILKREFQSVDEAKDDGIREGVCRLCRRSVFLNKSGGLSHVSPLCPTFSTAYASAGSNAAAVKALWMPPASGLS